MAMVLILAVVAAIGLWNWYKTPPKPPEPKYGWVPTKQITIFGFPIGSVKEIRKIKD
jgi:hypothetical protein